ncbi:ATP-binding cassette domain-containing protein [Corynebacterium glyciniphilum]|uniref:ATP-binding cassette domain-containing protein n=1 Tax=Corynebacterium glyciniphilum TaxID=1404244 RepID=UPI002650D909|nr:ATP-binding cassette domain-containing protein [Corynebacterium glyciniphilum]MDN6707005.1 ATP-binding cassette domain-containing protein [Corynebacterium glyciniphilum]
MTFSYDAVTDPALSRASLHAAAGEITALVGPSGSGKSKVANLIARLWDIDEGTVRVGGVDVRELGNAGVLSTVTTVFQEVYLFDDTVRANLTLGRPGATEDKIRSAVDAAQGLDVARALLKNSPVLILDEAVSAVDPGTEERIQSALSRLAAGRTVIVIAHRISTIRDVPHIVVVDAGCVVGSGTHEELLDSCATYRDLADERRQRGQSSVTGTG